MSKCVSITLLTPTTDSDVTTVRELRALVGKVVIDPDCFGVKLKDDDCLCQVDMGVTLHRAKVKGKIGGFQKVDITEWTVKV